MAILINPITLGLIALAPDGLEDALGALYLLQGRGEWFAPSRQIRYTANGKAADALLPEYRLQEHHNCLLIRIPPL
jgi:hypothetical protein